MNPTTKAMLERTLECFTEAFGSTRIGWDRFLEVVAADHRFSLVKGMEDAFSWISHKQELREGFLRHYDRKLLKEDAYDYLGDLYFEQVFDGDPQIKRTYLYSQSQLELVLRGLSKLSSDRMLSILDPQAGTGRVLGAIRKAHPSIIPFGVEGNLDLYRIALTNFAIQGNPGYLLHADQHYHEIDIARAAGRANWQYANRWNSHMADLQPTELKAVRNFRKPTGSNGNRSS